MRSTFESFYFWAFRIVVCSSFPFDIVDAYFWFALFRSHASLPDICHTWHCRLLTSNGFLLFIKYLLKNVLNLTDRGIVEIRSSSAYQFRWILQVVFIFYCTVKVRFMVGMLTLQLWYQGVIALLILFVPASDTMFLIMGIVEISIFVNKLRTGWLISSLSFQSAQKVSLIILLIRSICATRALAVFQGIIVLGEWFGKHWYFSTIKLTFLIKNLGGRAMKLNGEELQWWYAQERYLSLCFQRGQINSPVSEFFWGWLTI